MKQYLDLAKRILTDERSGYTFNSRTGMGTISLFGPQIEFDLREGFPICTTKRVGNKTVLKELLWFLGGGRNLRDLLDEGVHIWDDNAFMFYLRNQGREKEFPVYSSEWLKERDSFVGRVASDASFAKVHGDMGRIYGAQWRNWKCSDGREIDQIEGLIKNLKQDPSSRKHIVSSWNPGELEIAALPPCHASFQLNAQDGFLDLKMYQRSGDIFLGVPFNISSYAHLLSILAQETDLKPRFFYHTFGNAHIYCSIGERAEFYRENFDWLRGKVRESEAKDYLPILEELNHRLPLEVVQGRIIERPEDSFDHVTAVLEQMAREPRELPSLSIRKKHYLDLSVDDFKLEGYNPHPTIRRAMAA